MKLTKEIEVTLSLKAVLSDSGELQMSLAASAPYGQRTATATITSFPDEVIEEVTEVLQRVMDENAQAAAALAENAAAEARVAAVRLGEEL